MKKYIGNIIVSGPNFKVDECFNKCMNMTNVDESLPTLIIGLENAKKYISNFNILKKKYEDGMLWWTFSKTEKRNDHEKDIADFHTFCLNNIINNINYFYINYVNLTYNKAKRCINYIKSNIKKYYYIDNNKFVFVHDLEKKTNVYGFSLNTCSFFGISKSKVVSLIQNNPNNKKINNFYSIPNKIRKIIDEYIPSEMVLLDYF